MSHEETVIELIKLALADLKNVSTEQIGEFTKDLKRLNPQEASALLKTWKKRALL